MQIKVLLTSKHSIRTHIITHHDVINRTYGSEYRICDQDLSLGHHHLRRIDQRTRLGNL